jgi:hypothetical protein
MFMNKLTIAARLATLGLLIGGIPAYRAWALDPARPSQPGAADAQKNAAAIPADQFDKLRALIKPKPGGFDDIPWMTDLWEARKKAAAEGKPILIWVGDGHPLGWT